jgi:hypothetical protein
MAKSKRKLVYKPAPGAGFGKEAAQAIGERLEDLEASLGPLTPAMIVHEAASPSSPLHRYFTWDDTEAARRRRLDEARHLTNHLLVVVHQDSQERQTRGWHSVRFVDAGREDRAQAYASLATVHNSPAMRAQVIDQARRELKTWQLRYREYQELLGVSRAIDEFLSPAA